VYAKMWLQEEENGIFENNLYLFIIDVSEKYTFSVCEIAVYFNKTQ